LLFEENFVLLLSLFFSEALVSLFFFTLFLQSFLKGYWRMGNIYKFFFQLFTPPFLFFTLLFPL
jgi:hypothetical protein